MIERVLCAYSRCSPRLTNGTLLKGNNWTIACCKKEYSHQNNYKALQLRASHQVSRSDTHPMAMISALVAARKTGF